MSDRNDADRLAETCGLPSASDHAMAMHEKRRLQTELASAEADRDAWQARVGLREDWIATLTADRDALRASNVALLALLEEAGKDRRAAIEQRDALISTNAEHVSRARELESARAQWKALARAANERLATAVGLLRGLPFPFPEWPEIKAFLADGGGKG